MSLIPQTQPVPIVEDNDGVLRVQNTRVTLDTVIAAFHDGLSAEEIAEQYPSLELAVVYAVIGYYLSQRSEIDAYLASRDVNARSVREENEQKFSPSGIRDRLLARRKDA